MKVALSLRWSGGYKPAPDQERARRFDQHVLADVDYLKSRGYNPVRFLTRVRLFWGEGA